MNSSAQPPSQASTPPSRKIGGRFWHRVSEGRDIDDLWTQFAADTRSSYGFYGKDVDWDQVNKLPAWRRPFRIAGQLFWAMMNKLTPARRVLLLVALFLLLLSGIQFQLGSQIHVEIKFEFVAALLFLLLLLELADKVIMKRDLEIAREIQSWLVPSRLRRKFLMPKLPSGLVRKISSPVIITTLFTLLLSPIPTAN